MTAAEPNWTFDRTGFPYLPVPGTKIEVAVLPITKAQAEVYLGDPAGPGDDWYAEILGISPRAAWRVPGRVAAWHLLLTGITVEEALGLAAWLGSEYRLPDVQEWRLADRALSALTPDQLLKLADRIDAGDGHPAVAGILRRLQAAGRRTAGGMTFLEAGVLEWVTRPQPPPGALGRLSPELNPGLIIDPQKFDPVTLIRRDRNPAFGARLVRTPAPAEEP